MNLDKVPEEEEADSDTASMRSFDLPITSLQESLPQSFIDKNKQSSLNKSKSQSKKDETSRPSSASLKDNIRPSSGSKKVKPSAPVPPPVPPPHNSSHGPGAPPPPPQAAPPPPPVGADKKSTIYPAAKFSARDLKLSKKKLRRAEEILKMGMNDINPYHAEYIKMPCPLLIFSQLYYLVKVVDTYQHT